MLRTLPADEKAEPQIPKGAYAFAIMTKAPRPGEVKTRLTPPLTPQEAALLSSCFLQDTATLLDAITQNKLIRRVAVYTPAGADSFYAELLPPGFLFVQQRGETFGERVISALEDLFSLGFSFVCLLDSDSPTLPSSALTETMRVLSQLEGDLVIGPAADGGYYLIALRELHKTLFEEISWSSERVFQQTMERARELNLKVHILPPWYDVDDPTALHRLCEEFFSAGAKTGQEHVAPATRRYLESLLKQEGRQRIWPDRAKE